MGLEVQLFILCIYNISLFDRLLYGKLSGLMEIYLSKTSGSQLQKAMVLILSEIRFNNNTFMKQV